MGDWRDGVHPHCCEEIQKQKRHMRDVELVYQVFKPLKGAVLVVQDFVTNVLVHSPCR